MDLKSQLEALGMRKGAAHLTPAAGARTRASGIEGLVAGAVIENQAGGCFVARLSHEPAHCHGTAPLGQFLALNPATLARLAKDDSLSRVDVRRAAFIDMETTGLAGGTGTYAFLIGIGYFEDGQFVVEQFFMRDYGEEPAQLLALAERLARFDAVVSFNGKAFDLPLLQTRLALSRLPFALAGAPHLDLLFPARRIWQSSLPSCALSSLEIEVLGVRRTGDDVPGYLIPALYFDYVRSGDARPLAGVFYHNVQDILSLVSLSTRLCHLFENPLDAGVSPMEKLGVARMYEDAGRIDESVQAYHSALCGPLDGGMAWDARRHLSLMLKRAGRRDEAVDIWRAMLESENPSDVFPFVELAKHHEWHDFDLDAAIAVTLRAREHMQRRRPLWQHQQAVQELEHRLSRLQRKLAGGVSAAASELDEEREE